jgi:hypothetical protein
MDAMDEGAGGRGWEKLAPEERVKLLRERRDDESPGASLDGRSPGASSQGFMFESPSR